MRKERSEYGKKVLVYFISFLMVGSVFGFIFLGFRSGGSQSVKYNGFEFTNRGNYWSAEINGREALFTYFPADVELLPVDSLIIERLRSSVEIDVTSDFNDTFAEQIALAEYNMGITLNSFNIFFRQGFTTQNQFNSPLITCNDATQNIPVIYFKSSNLTSISSDNNCIIVESGTQVDFERAKDRILYGILGVI